MIKSADGLAPPPRSLAALTHWSNPSSYHRSWTQRARFAARMIQPKDWVCDLGCGPQALRWFLPRSAIYLPADLKRWTPDTEFCDLNSGVMPHRSLEVCDVCAMLGVITYLDDPEALFRELARTVERVLLSYFDTTAAHENNFLWGRATSLDELGNILSSNGFRIVEQAPYRTWVLIRADNQKFDEGAR